MRTPSVPVQLFTKPHISAFLHNNFGDRPSIDSNHIFHNFLILCLCHQLQYRVPDVPEYPVEMKIYITKRDYELYGCWMNPRQQQLFNGHVDFYMKAVLVAHADTYILNKPNSKLKDALVYALDQLQIDDEDWNLESVTRYYHRLRSNKGNFLMYRKENAKKPFTFLSDYKN